MCAAKPGIVGFSKDYKTTRSFSDKDTDEIFDLIQTSTGSPQLAEFQATCGPRSMRLVNKKC
jgi:hypothetical protein